MKTKNTASLMPHRPCRHIERALTNAPSIGCPLWFHCGWTFNWINVWSHVGKSLCKKKVIHLYYICTSGYPWPLDTVKSPVSLNLVLETFIFFIFYFYVFSVFIIILYNKNKVFLFHFCIFVYLDASLKFGERRHTSFFFK